MRPSGPNLLGDSQSRRWPVNDHARDDPFARGRVET